MACGRVESEAGFGARADRSRRSLEGRRAARVDTLEACLEEIRLECDRIGRDPAEIEITTGSVPTPDEVKRLEDLGVERFVTGPPGFTPEQVTEGLEKMGDELISKFS